MPAQNENTANLHGFTDDPGAASTDAVARPRAGDPPVLWYRDTKPRFYRPYLVRVLKRDDAMMELVFLNSYTGADLELSKPAYEIAYHDGRYAYSALPSTAQKARPGSAQDCGLLFISDLYMQDLPQADRDAILAAGLADGKWPYSLGGLSALVSRMQSRLGGSLFSKIETNVAWILRRLKAVTS